MNDKTFFAKLRQESTVVPGMVRKFAKFLVIAGPTVGACLLMLAGTLLVGGHTHKDYIAGPALAGLGIAVVSLFLARGERFVEFGAEGIGSLEVCV